MNKHVPLITFLLLEIIVITYIFSTTQFLPVNVATHFDMNGVPNGFMPKSSYAIFVLIMSAGIPALVVLSVSLVLLVSQNNINIPNKAYWLSPEKRPETVRFIRNHVIWLGSMLGVFMGYVHWTILNANAAIPPHMTRPQLLVGVGVLLGSVLLWVILLMIRFSKTPAIP